MNISFDPSGKAQGPVAKVVAALVGVLTLVAAFMFSLVLLGVVVLAALALWLYFWWKTRALRRAVREQMQAQQDAMDAMQRDGFGARPEAPAAAGEVIEGEAVRVVDEKNRLSS